jgi:hypothetical protein
MEQLELKHAQYERVIDYYSKHSEIWQDLANAADSAGAAAYARKQCAIFNQRRKLAQESYQRCSIPALANKEGSMMERVLEWRRKEFHPLKHRFPEYSYVYANIQS